MNAEEFALGEEFEVFEFDPTTEEPFSVSYQHYPDPCDPASTPLNPNPDDPNEPPPNYPVPMEDTEDPDKVTIDIKKRDFTHGAVVYWIEVSENGGPFQRVNMEDGSVLDGWEVLADDPADAEGSLAPDGARLTVRTLDAAKPADIEARLGLKLVTLRTSSSE